MLGKVQSQVRESKMDSQREYDKGCGYKEGQGINFNNLIQHQGKQKSQKQMQCIDDLTSDFLASPWCKSNTH
jgi:hypothetical protein